MASYFYKKKIMVKNFFSGISAYSKAIQHISKYRMWGYVLLPGLLSLVLGAAVFSTAWGLSDNIGGLIDGWWKWDFGRSVVEKIAQVFGGLLVVVLGILVFRQMVMVVLAPFMSILSEKVEAQLRGRKSDRPFTLKQVISDLSRGLRLALRNIVRELSATALLFLLGLIPFFTPFTTVLIFLLQSYYVGFGNIDFTLERHLNYRESIRFVGRNRSLAIGNGAVFMLLLFTFIGFFFALPLGTVAATIETVKRLPDGISESEVV